MNNKAFRYKFLIHRSSVTKFIKSKYSLSNEEAEDVVQNAYIKIYRRFRNNNFVCKFPRQYLFNAVVNCTIEYKTRKAHLKNEATFTEFNIEFPETFLDLTNEMDFSQVPDSLTEKKIIFDELNFLIDKLAEKNPEYSKILKMFYFDEMKAIEISEELNVPENTIKTRLHRGRNKLKSLLQEDMVISSK